MKGFWPGVLLFVACVGVLVVQAQESPGTSTPLGLPPLPVAHDNPQTPEKIALGEKLFNDKRFSTTGEVSCATCHDATKAFTDSPLKTSEGINKLTGTRNAPTVINALYFDKQFWDGRSSCALKIRRSIRSSIRWNRVCKTISRFSISSIPIPITSPLSRSFSARRGRTSR